MYVLRVGGIIVGSFTCPQPHDQNVEEIADDDPELLEFLEQ